MLDVPRLPRDPTGLMWMRCGSGAESQSNKAFRHTPWVPNRTHAEPNAPFAASPDVKKAPTISRQGLIRFLFLADGYVLNLPVFSSEHQTGNFITGVLRCG